MIRNITLPTLAAQPSAEDAPVEKGSLAGKLLVAAPSLVTLFPEIVAPPPVTEPAVPVVTEGRTAGSVVKVMPDP
jgi:hypothetical protein